MAIDLTPISMRVSHIAESLNTKTLISDLLNKILKLAVAMGSTPISMRGSHIGETDKTRVALVHSVLFIFIVYRPHIDRIVMFDKIAERTE